MYDITEQLHELLEGKNPKSSMLESADHDVFVVEFEGDKGHASVWLEPDRGFGVNGYLSHESGELSINEIHMFKGYARQENYEPHF